MTKILASLVVIAFLSTAPAIAATKQPLLQTTAAKKQNRSKTAAPRSTKKPASTPKPAAKPTKKP